MLTVHFHAHSNNTSVFTHTHPRKSVHPRNFWFHLPVWKLYKFVSLLYSCYTEKSRDAVIPLVASSHGPHLIKFYKVPEISDTGNTPEIGEL